MQRVTVCYRNVQSQIRAPKAGYERQSGILEDRCRSNSWGMCGPRSHRDSLLSFVSLVCSMMGRCSKSTKTLQVHVIPMSSALCDEEIIRKVARYVPFNGQCVSTI